MNTTTTAINQAVVTEIKAERARSGLTIQQLSDNSGVTLSVVKRILAGTLDVNVSDLSMLCKAFSEASSREVTPQILFERAVEAAGGYDVIYADLGYGPGKPTADA
jgi:predicted transcriptional regulator